MPSIRILPEPLVNKIAAGEVVERPASVVKELMENSLDAGAARIDVRVEDGGRKRICVADDGAGMEADDLALSVRPHATSKLPDEDSLFSIGTLGFRGEALASVASISHLHIRTRRADQPGGHEIEVEGGRIGPVRSAACACGTTVDVRDIFYNTPARRKFLRTPSTEMGHVAEQVARVALGFPKVHIRLEHNGRVVHDLPPCPSLRERIGELHGPDLADVLIPVERTESAAGLGLRGLVAPPSSSRTTNHWQYFFLNGRYVRDRFMLHALKEAYRGLIDPNRHPVAYLWLEIRPDLVDVNVHPTKIEVRFQDSGMVHSLILATLRQTLQRADLAPPARATPVEPNETPLADHQREVRQAIADFFKRTPPQQPASYAAGHAAAPGRTYDRTPHGSRPDEQRSAVAPLPASPQTTPPPHSMPFAQAPAAARAMQLHNTYLVAETDDGLIIVDQHALHERIIYEQLRRRINEGRLESQRLLIPEMIDVTPAQMAVLDEAAELLARLGIEVGHFGPRTVAVQSFPSKLANVDVLAFMKDLLDRLADKAGQSQPEQLLSDILDMAACKAAVKAGDRLTPSEIEALLSQRELVERGSNCPHGRPTTLRMTVSDLQKQFGRV